MVLKRTAEYAEFLATSNFSFLQGGSHPEEYIAAAAQAGYAGLGLADANTLAGAVRAHLAAKERGFAWRAGCRLTISRPDGAGGACLFETAAYPATRTAYGKLCSLLTIGKKNAAKDPFSLQFSELLPYLEDQVFIIVPPPGLAADIKLTEAFAVFCGDLKEALQDRRLLSIALIRNYQNGARYFEREVIKTASRHALPLVASNDAYCHVPERRPLLDVLTCIRHKCTLEQAGDLLMPNAERCLKPPAEMARLFRDRPAAVRRTLEILELTAGFSLEQLRYEYPAEIVPPGQRPIEYLSELTAAGAAERYPAGVPLKVQALIKEELRLIEELHYEKYFLTCFDIVRFAKAHGILCQGRGSAANSAVCYCLGITAVDPSRIDLLFARFVSKERSEPPDIDIDFEHERREEVIQFIYRKFGRSRAGLVAEVITYRARSALREVGKALGFPAETVGRLAKSVHSWTDYEVAPQDLAALGLDPGHHTLRNLLTLAKELYGFPRHLSQHVGGFLISETPLSQTVPIIHAAMENRTMIEWDKDDIEALGMLKIDILGLGMLTCIRKALDALNARRQEGRLPHVELYSIPAEDPAVYDMLCAGDTIGVFQVESRAQMSMLPRLQPRCFYDLVIEVAIVRPGPIQGKMVHPYLRRRSGREQISFPDRRAAEILGKTMGVPIFQEQAMRLAVVLAGFSPGEAEQLRRSLAAWRRNEQSILKFKARVIAGMLKNGYDLEFAESCMRQIQGFSEYGFPESHAASFALLVYASAWIKRYYPAEFAAALINSQPMGFYAPAQIIRDAESRGIEVRPIDLNFSAWDCTLETTGTARALRLGLRLIKGLAEEQAQRLADLVKRQGPFKSMARLWQSAYPELHLGTLYTLAKADACRSMGLSRRRAFWCLRALPRRPLPVDRLAPAAAGDAALPRQSLQQSMFDDYYYTGFSLKAHPLGLMRPTLKQRGVSPILELRQRRPHGAGSRVAVAGIILFRQRPGTAKGVVFVTLEDEGACANLIIRPALFEEHSRMIITSLGLLARGRLQFVGNSVYIEAEELESLDLAQGALSAPKYY